MIELFRHKKCESCSQVEDKLKELVLAYSVTVIEGTNLPEFVKNNTELPLIKDGDEIISGKNEFEKYFIRLEKLVADWRKFQSDSCYIDDNGEVC